MIYGESYYERCQRLNEEHRAFFNNIREWKTKFAFLPVEIEGGKKLWLEKYQERFRSDNWDYYRQWPSQLYVDACQSWCYNRRPYEK